MKNQFFKQLQHVKLISMEKHCVVFHQNSLGFGVLDKLMGRVLSLLQRSVIDKTIRSQLCMNQVDLAEMKKKLKTFVSMLEKIEVKKISQKKPVTVYLNVSQNCNLRCVYCYANFGMYHSKMDVEGMSEHIAKKTIDRFYDQFAMIGTVVFFGGEPLLKTTLIEEICEYCVQKATIKAVAIPKFSIVTNGVLITSKVARLLQRYKFSVTVSLDGPKAINDCLRLTATGKGSFSKISHGLECLSNVHITPNIEATYTQEHVRRNITPKILLQFFQKSYGVRTVTLSPIAAKEDDQRRVSSFYKQIVPLYREAANFSLHSLLGKQPIVLFHVQQIIRSLLLRQKKDLHQFCYVHLGKELFSISSKGKVYPCQMMNDRKEFEMGNILNDRMFLNKKFHHIQQKFLLINKEHLPCKSCWMKNLCFVCLAGVEIETGNLVPVPQHRCELIRNIGEEVLCFLSDIFNSPLKMKKVFHNLFQV